MLTNVNITIAKHAGACYGVNRALELTNEAISENDEVFTYGEIIHNPVVVENLRENGVRVIDKPREEGGCVVLRSHGVSPQIEEEIAKLSKVIDATCPFVKKAQVVAKKLGENHKQVIIVGEQGHPEVEALVSYAKLAGAEVFVVSKASDISNLDLFDVGILSQTTQSNEAFDSVAKRIAEKGVRHEIKNTICSATAMRQKSAIELAETVDVMIVLGGRNSANTTRLFDLCKRECDSTFHVERSSEFEELVCQIKEILEDRQSCVVNVGITAGASTPESQIEELREFLETNL